MTDTSPVTGSRSLRAYASFIVSHRIAVIVLLLIATGFLMSRMGNLQIDNDPDLFTPPSHPYVVATHELERIFGGRNVTIIGIVPRHGDVFQPAVLDKVKHIQQRIELLPNAIRHNIQSLAARKVKVINGTADGMAVKPMMEEVPRTPEGIARLKAALAAMPLYSNILVSPDHRAAAVIADFKTSQEFTAMLAGVRKIVSEESDSSVDVYLGGQTVIAAEAEHYFNQMPIYFGAALLIIMVIQYWSFRSFQGMFLPTLTGILGVIWGLSIMGLLKVHLDGLTITTPILILAIAAGHAIQILKRYYEEYRRALADGVARKEANRSAIIESLARTGPIMITAGLIAMITFYSLTASDLPMVRHFGFLAGGGVLSVMILELTLIPALRALLPAPKIRDAAREQKSGILDRFLTGLANQLVGGRAPLLVGAGLVLIIAIGAGATVLRVDNDFKLYFKPNSQLRVEDNVLNRTFAGTNSIQFLVRTPHADGVKDPRVLQAIDKLQTFLNSQPYVGKTQSIADLIKRMNMAMHADSKTYDRVPDRRDLVAQYLFLYSLSGDPQDFDSLVDNDYQRAAVWVYLKNESTAYADTLAHKAQDILAQSLPPGVTVQMGGSLPQVVALNEVVVREKVYNMLQMAIVVFVLSAIVLRSLVGGLFVLAPLGAIVATNFGLMGWLGITLDVTAVTIAAMAVGIGADYEIYLLFRFREELAKRRDVLAATRESLLTSGKAVLFVALSVIGGYAVLQVSGFAFYENLSTLVIATMAVSAIFALFFLRALMMLFKPRFLFGKDRSAYFPPSTAAIPESAE